MHMSHDDERAPSVEQMLMCMLRFERLGLKRNGTTVGEIWADRGRLRSKKATQNVSVTKELKLSYWHLAQGFDSLLHKQHVSFLRGSNDSQDDASQDFPLVLAASHYYCPDCKEWRMHDCGMLQGRWIHADESARLTNATDGNHMVSTSKFRVLFRVLFPGEEFWGPFTRDSLVRRWRDNYKRASRREEVVSLGDFEGGRFIISLPLELGLWLHHLRSLLNFLAAEDAFAVAFPCQRTNLSGVASEESQGLDWTTPELLPSYSIAFLFLNWNCKQLSAAWSSYLPRLRTMLLLRLLLAPLLLLTSVDFLAMVLSESSSDVGMGLRFFQASVSLWMPHF